MFAALAKALEKYSGSIGDHAYWSDDAPCSMHIDELEAIWEPSPDLRDRPSQRLTP